MLSTFFSKSRGVFSGLFSPRENLSKKVVASVPSGTKKALPEFPKVRASGRMVEILWSPSQREIWGEEETAFEAQSVASEMEIELKSIEYVKACMREYLEGLYGDLLGLDVPRRMARSALDSANLTLLRTIVQLGEGDGVGSTEGL